ncbi:MAG TPA: glycosyltransferase family 4 protein [Bacteroidia bacterium]|jgi:glycosyltransferase involved in cell wall biosynthesis
MSKRKILVFIDWFRPGFRAGGPVQSCVNLIDHLKSEFDFSVITSDTDYMEDKPYAGIKSDEWIVREDGVRVYYFSKGELNRANMEALIEKEKFDVAYLNGMFSKTFTLLPLRILKKKKKGKIIVAVRGMLAPSALEIKAWKKRIFLSYAKLTGIYSGVKFQSTSGQESKDILKIFRNADILTAPNLPEKVSAGRTGQREKRRGELSVVNIARIAPEKNLLFALQVLEKVKANVEFDFYGPIYDKEYWKQCREQIKKIPANVRVNYKGVLDASKVSETLSQCHYMFMPTRGENFGHVILQSFMAGTPVIISDQTPWRELKEKGIGHDLPLSDQDQFAAVLDQCAALSREEFDAISEGVYAYAKGEQENVQASIEKYRQLFS